MSYEVIENCVPGPGVQLELDHALYKSCDCHVNCKKGSCPCMDSCAYNKDLETLRDEFMLEGSPPIFECNQYCTCSIGCINRTTQRKKTDDVIVKESPGKGAGLFASKDIPCGYFIGEYVGEVIKVAMATERLQRLSENDSCYLIQFKEHDVPSGVTVTTCIDARFYGNHTRFSNHSCTPNMFMVAVRRESVVPHLCLFTIAPVSTGEELLFSYCAGSSNTTVGSKPCLCGSANCMKYLPFQH